MLVFLPLSSDELTAWATTGTLTPQQAYAVTADLRASFGFAVADEEDAEHTVLHVAGLASLLTSGVRLVAVVDAAADPVVGAGFGDVTLGATPFTAITALFADDVPARATTLRERLEGVSLETAWDDDEVAAFMSEHELLWHGPGEWDSLH